MPDFSVTHHPGYSAGGLGGYSSQHAVELNSYCTHCTQSLIGLGLDAELLVDHSSSGVEDQKGGKAECLAPREG